MIKTSKINKKTIKRIRKAFIEYFEQGDERNDFYLKFLNTLNDDDFMSFVADSFEEALE